ncbi:hypothetical protein [Cupriavidus necator]|uniref:hypothetical protein n=1 Tax=Cupriavidus necator TaxID=106590 RepID=UPI003BEF1DD9
MAASAATRWWADQALPFAESRRASHSSASYLPHTHPTLSVGAVDRCLPWSWSGTCWWRMASGIRRWRRASGARCGRVERITGAVLWLLAFAVAWHALR